jgi:hypothetical protein
MYSRRGCKRLKLRSRAQSTESLHDDYHPFLGLGFGGSVTESPSFQVYSEKGLPMDLNLEAPQLDVSNNSPSSSVDSCGKGTDSPHPGAGDTNDGNVTPKKVDTTVDCLPSSMASQPVEPIVTTPRVSKPEKGEFILELHAIIEEEELRDDSSSISSRSPIKRGAKCSPKSRVISLLPQNFMPRVLMLKRRLRFSP